MENIFDMPILEQMFIFRKEDIDKAIYNNNKEVRELGEKICNTGEEILAFVKERIKGKEDLEKLEGMMLQYELDFRNEIYFWSNMYYKIGLNDMYKFRYELKNPINAVNDEKSTFLNYVESELDEYIQRKIIFNSEIYKEYKEKCRELDKKYPRVLKVFEDSTPLQLNEEEMKKLMEIKELDAKVRAEEIKVCFKAGINEILNF